MSDGLRRRITRLWKKPDVYVNEGDTMTITDGDGLVVLLLATGPGTQATAPFQVLTPEEFQELRGKTTVIHP
jgi:hypothetical protein